MPVIQAILIEGYDDQTLQKLAMRLTDAARSVIQAPLDGITVSIQQVKPAAYMRGRQSRIPGQPQPMATDIVRAFLEAMEARDLKAANAHLAKDFSMVFPGGVVFEKLQDLTAWASERYHFVVKTYERFDESFDDNTSVVYCFGTLSGEWLDGTAFDTIRFIDRFEIENGKLIDQKVWNDLESRP